jgi:serine/threonine protein kinase
MQLLAKLLAFALRYSLNKNQYETIEWLEQQYAEPSQILFKVISQAESQTWQLIEIILIDGSLWTRLQVLFVKYKTQGILNVLRNWVDQQGKSFRNDCIAELQIAKRVGLLTGINNWQRFVMEVHKNLAIISGNMTDDARIIMAAIVNQLGANYVNLSKLLCGNDGIFLITAFNYFLWNKVVNEFKLDQELNAQSSSNIWHNQQSDWIVLNQLLIEHSGAISKVLERINVESDASAQQRTLADALQRAALARLSNSAKTGGIRPKLSAALRSSTNIALLTELERRLEMLPIEVRSPQLLDAVGRLAIAIGLFDKAFKHFQQAATIAAQRNLLLLEAEAHYNSFRALLEQQQWESALSELLKAAQLDPVNFVPFPLEKYQPQRILGAGGFGVAFLCIHKHFVEPMVVKTLYSEILDRNITEVFSEGRILRRMKHPSIIEVLDCDYAGSGQQRPYLIIEYFDGISLSEYIKKYGLLNLDQTVNLAQLVAEALLAAHQNKVLHRDIKPDNLLVRLEDNNQWSIKIIDFGLAITGKQILKTVATGIADRSILGASFGGTFQYSAPEQLGTIAGKIGTWSDVYAFGKTISQALFGTTQPTPRNYKMLGNHPLIELLGECLEQDPQHRPQDFAAVLDVLKAPVTNVNKQKLISIQTLPETVIKPQSTVIETHKSSVQSVGVEQQLAVLMSQVENEELHLAEVKRKRELEIRLKAEAEKLAELKQHRVALEKESLSIQHGRYLIHNDGTVTDTKTKLMWKRFSEGQTWHGDACVGEAMTVPWEQVMPDGKQRQWSEFAEYNDWRVPTKEELCSLIYCSSGNPRTWNDTGSGCEGESKMPTIDQIAFPNTPASWYWTSTVDSGSTGSAWVILFYYGYVYPYNCNNNCAVRLVRRP